MTVPDFVIDDAGFGRLRPLILGYFRVWAADPPDTRALLAAEIHSYAEREGLTLGHVFTDLYDPSHDHPERSAFCALMDALRRQEVRAVAIPSPEHLSRHPGSYRARRTIIENEAGARLLVIEDRHQ